LGDLPNPLKESQEEPAIDVILDGKSHGQTPPNPDGDLRPAKDFPPLPVAAAASAPAATAAAKPPKPTQVASKS
jgi:hypothetical protein